MSEGSLIGVWMACGGNNVLCCVFVGNFVLCCCASDVNFHCVLLLVYYQHGRGKEEHVCL